MMEQLFTELTLWHWLALALILFGIEMMIGTFDLLMVSIAAAATSAFAYLAPDGLATWQGQCVFFAIAAVGLIIGGRVLFSGARAGKDVDPILNKRMNRLAGQRGQATGDFEAGQGQVKIGDTVWGADAAGDEMIREGDTVIVEGARSTNVIVRKL